MPNERETITLYKPFDAHIHLRDSLALATTVAHAAKQFSGIIAMPNLSPPLITPEEALLYHQQITEHTPPQQYFKPYTTVYLTKEINIKNIETIASEPKIIGIKWYPKGVTTNSRWGVTDINSLTPIFEAMAYHQVPLLIHGESPDPNIDIFRREEQFINVTLTQIIKKHPKLKIILEHITTAQAVQFIENTPDNIAATITAHHLLYNRNHLLSGGIRPHLYCLPILKTEPDRHALIKAATNGNSKFFLGTDSAPHAKSTKETACGCAGIYTAHAAIELYASVFEQANALNKLEQFASLNARNFYNLPKEDLPKITLTKEDWLVPDAYPLGKEKVIPLKAKETLSWKIID